MTHSIFSEFPTAEFGEEDAPDWLTSRKTIPGSTGDMRWFWEGHVKTLPVGGSIETDFNIITRIS